LTADELGKIYRNGEIIVRQGDVGDSMFVIQEGEAEVVVEKEGKEVLLRMARKGEIIGEMAVFEKVKRSATVRALGNVRVLTVDKKNFLRRIHEDPTLAFRIVEIMSGRIRELSEEIARLKKTD
jgi:CRP/FNR family cyclic AMP-dependent transcriptional regulator